MWKAPSLLPKRAAVKVVSQNPSKGERLVFLCITMKNVYERLKIPFFIVPYMFDLLLKDLEYVKSIKSART